MVLTNEVRGIKGCNKLFDKYPNIYYVCGSKLINSDGKEIRKGVKNICNRCIAVMESVNK
jgi:hypothetical protein